MKIKIEIPKFFINFAATKLRRGPIHLDGLGNKPNIQYITHSTIFNLQTL